MARPDSSGRSSSRRRERDRPLDEPLTRELLSHLPGMAYRCRLDAAWTMEYVSAGCRDLTGFGPEDLQENRIVSYSSLIHADDREKVARAVEDAITGGRAFRITYRIRRADGKERWVWEQGSAIRGAGGEVEALQGFVTDITHRQELAARADGAFRLFHSLTEQSFTGVFVLRQARVAYANPRFLELFGLPEHRAVEGLSMAELIRERDRDEVVDEIQALESGASEVARFELTTARSDGVDRVLQAQLNAVLYEGERSVLGVLLDVTEKKRAERRYHEARKMESLGQLARGIAHDFNNILAVVKAAAHMLTDVPSLDAEFREDVQRIQEAVVRGTALSRQLTTFGQVDEAGVRRLRVSRVVGDLLPMLGRLCGDGIELQVHVEDGLPPLSMSPSHLEQIIMNLVTNARDAMPEGGTIRVGARGAAEGPVGGPPQHCARPHVILTVEDEGTGIESELLPHLFEPYFTTKGDQGTGLGLGNVWRIATELGGGVRVDSEVGRGSTFSVHLPVVEG